MATTPPPAFKKRTLYEILGVEHDANAIDIGMAYKARLSAIKRSPNVDPNDLTLLNEAYHILCMPNERAAYDARLLTLAEKAAAAESAASPDLVVETDDEPEPIWKNKYALGGAGLLLLVVLFWMFKSSPAPAPVVAPVAPRIVAPPPVVPPPAPVARSGEELFAALSPSIARITVFDVGGRAVGIGSGVVIAPGTLITNCHVATAGGTLAVKVGAESLTAHVEVADEEYDLCRLSVTGMSAPAVTLGSVESLKTGQKVYAIGAPAGLDLTISDGIVSSLREVPQGKVIQTTAPISPGSSGGGLFDAYGRLVGIMTFQHRYGQNLNFAIPADWLSDMRARTATVPVSDSVAKSLAPQ
jgi:serine protease Do